MSRERRREGRGREGGEKEGAAHRFINQTNPELSVARATIVSLKTYQQTSPLTMHLYYFLFSAECSVLLAPVSRPPDSSILITWIFLKHESYSSYS